VWDAIAGRARHVLEGHTAYVHCVAFAPSGSLAFSGADDETVRIWNVSSGRLVRVIECDEDVRSLAVSADGAWVATGGGDGTVRLWEVATGRLGCVLGGGTRSVHTVAFSPDGERVLSATTNGLLRSWDVSDSLDVSNQPPRPRHDY
jgi:WD40 repeat protein